MNDAHEAPGRKALADLVDFLDADGEHLIPAADVLAAAKLATFGHDIWALATRTLLASYNTWHQSRYRVLTAAHGMLARHAEITEWAEHLAVLNPPDPAAGRCDRTIELPLMTPADASAAGAPLATQLD